MQVNNKLKILYISNAGIYIDGPSGGILIDGIFSKYDGFDSMPENAYNLIINKFSPFENLKILLFTHKHPDHYNKDYVNEFLKRYPDTIIITPDNILPALPDYMKIHRLQTKHLLLKTCEVIHDAIFIEYNNKCIFVSGDSDPGSSKKQIMESFLNKYKGHINAAFVNPFFVSITPGRNLLNNINPDRIFIYHLPIKTDDTNRYNDIVNSGLKRSDFNNILELRQMMTEIII